MFDPILKKHADNIETFSYMTTTLNNDQHYDIRSAQASDNSRINKVAINIEAGQPTLFDALLDDFLDVDWHDRSALSYSEQLYSPKGS